MSISTNRAQLKSIVDGVMADDVGIAVTYNYQPSVISASATPAVCVIWDGSSDRTLSTSKNTWINKFVIRTILEETSDYSTQMNLLFTIVDALMVALRDKTNITLSGNAHKMLMTDVSPVLSSQLGNMKVWYIDIEVEVMSLESI